MGKYNFIFLNSKNKRYFDKIHRKILFGSTDQLYRELNFISPNIFNDVHLFNMTANTESQIYKHLSNKYG